MLEEPDNSAVPSNPPVAGRILKDYEASRRVTSEQAPNQTPRPDLTFPKKQFVPGSVPIPTQAQTFGRGGSKGSALKPWKPYAFALEHHPTDIGKCNVYHGRLISQVNAMSFDEVNLVGGTASLFTGQSGIENPNITTPSQFFAADGSQYLAVELGWTGDVYLYWETDGTGFITLCELRGPDVPDHVPLPLPEGELIGKFYVKIGEVGADYIEQEVSGDVFWYGAFVEVEETSDPSGSTGSGVPSGGGSGSDKSTAIVPVSFSKTGYAALFTMEAPDVRFEDVVEDLPVRGSHSRFTIDPRFIEVCAPGSIRVVGVSSDKPYAVGAYVEGNKLVIAALKDKRRRPHLVQVKLSAIRKGHEGKRFPSRTRIQFVANEKTLNAAYPRS